MSVFHNNALIGAAGQGAAAGAGYEIERSLRFNSADSAYLNRTPASAGNRKTWTYSVWLKRSELNTSKLFRFWSAGVTQQDSIYFNTNDTLQVYLYGGQGDANTLAKFRDTSAWYHIVLSVDTTQATTADRIRIYVNGEDLTNYVACTQNLDCSTNLNALHTISTLSDSPYAGANPFDGYLADAHLIDGQALDPTSFGEFDDNGVWQPIEYVGTYGTNGFHLPFNDNSSASALGTDTSGNGNDWTVNNIDPYTTQPAPTWYTSPTLYTTKTDITTNATPVSNGATVASGNYIYIVPSGSETNGEAIFSANGDLASNHKYWYRDGASWTQTGGGYNDTDFTTFEWGVDDSDTYRLQSNRSFYVLSNYDTSPANQSGDLPYFVTNNPGADSLLDSPTNGDTADDTGAGGEVPGNYCTFNPLANFLTLANGNLDVSQSTAAHHPTYGTFGISSGKWYFEYTKNDSIFSSNTSIALGIIGTGNMPINGSSSFSLYNAHTAYIQNGTAYYDNLTYPTTTPNSTTCHNAGVWMLAYDLDSGKGWIGKDGVWFAPGATSGGDPANGTNPIFTNFAAGQTYVPILHMYAATSVSANFGQRPFAYSAPSGFKALCTANLDTPTIEDGSTAMDVALYTGNGGTQTISGLGFSPDFVWLKSRSSAKIHTVYDTIRGAQNLLCTNDARAEQSNNNSLTAFSSDGFTVGSDTTVNESTKAHVGWCWDAGSSTAANTDGSISSSVRANANAGFSIVSYTGDGNYGSTLGHGLGAVPQFVVVKNRTNAYPWAVYHTSLGATKALFLEQTVTPVTSNVYWNDTAPTSSVFTVGAGARVNQSGANLIAYCFAPVEGYSAFGSYTGNGSSDGPFVYTGFRPRWILFKRTDDARNWWIVDTARKEYNIFDLRLKANVTDAESTGDILDVVSNGFKFRSSNSEYNIFGGTYIWASFAENPFRSARAR